METLSGAQFARLLLNAFDAMVAEVRTELERAGYPGLTVANEFAMQAIDGGAGNAAGLARMTGVSRQAAAKTIAGLEVLGYVDREVDQGDGRKKSVTLTTRGRRAIKVGAAAFDSIFERWRTTSGVHSAEVIAALERLVPDRPEGPRG